MGEHDADKTPLDGFQLMDGSSSTTGPTVHDAVYKQQIGGDKKTFEVADLDEHDNQKLIGPGGEDMGTFHLLGPIPRDGQIQVPDDRQRGVVFPVFSVVRQEGRVCRYVGPLERAMAMFCAHKGGLTIVPITDDLKRMVEVFDRHDGLDSDWAFKELKLVDVLGEQGLADIVRIARERGLIDKRGRRTAKVAEIDDIEAMPEQFIRTILPGKKLR